MIPVTTYISSSLVSHCNIRTLGFLCRMGTQGGTLCTHLQLCHCFTFLAFHYPSSTILFQITKGLTYFEKMHTGKTDKYLGLYARNTNNNISNTSLTVGSFLSQKHKKRENDQQSWIIHGHLALILLLPEGSTCPLRYTSALMASHSVIPLM